MIRVAAYQAAPKDTLESRKKQIHEVLKRADCEKIDFICFPEGFLTGYYAQELDARKTSLEIQGTLFKEFLHEIKQYHVTVIIGFNELSEGKLFNSVALVESGKLLGVQRKHYLYHNYFTPGFTFSCLQSKGITFGVIICLDANYFEPARLLACQGASILFCPMCNKVPLDHPYAKRPPYYSQLVARSHENRCWLIAADWIWASDGEMICPGHTSIYDPDGREISRSTEGKEELLMVEIAPDQLFQEKGRRMRGSPVLFEQITKSFQSEFKGCLA